MHYKQDALGPFGFPRHPHSPVDRDMHHVTMEMFTLSEKDMEVSVRVALRSIKPQTLIISKKSSRVAKTNLPFLRIYKERATF